MPPDSGKENAAMTIWSSHGRSIRYLRASITDRCNLRCTYCMPNGLVKKLPRADLLTMEELYDVIRVMVRSGVDKLRITGGEPLVRAGVVELIGRLRRLDGLREIAMTTNGTLLARQAGALKAAGLDRINVSLDSLRPDVFAAITKNGRLADVLRGLDVAEEVGLKPIKINAVAMRGLNEDDIPNLALLSLTRGWHVRFIEYMPIGCGASRWQDRFMPAAEILERVEAVGPLEPVEANPGDGPARYHRFPGAAGLVGIISPMTNHFCATCDRLRLTADGRLRSCLLAGGEVDLRARVRGGASEDELLAAVTEAAGLKPAWHGVEAPTEGLIDCAMSKMGG